MPRSKSFAKRVVRKIPAGVRQKVMGGISRVANNALVQDMVGTVAAGAAGTAAGAVNPIAGYVAAPATYYATTKGISAYGQFAARQQQKIKAKRMSKRSY